MSFTHVRAVDYKTLTSSERRIFAYDPQGRETCYVGFRDTREVLAWLGSDDRDVFKVFGEVDCITLAGEWEVDDAGSTYDFDGEELYPGESWADFKRDHAEHMREVEADNRRWREEIAREEGMLNGIDSYNDWMGY